jgi:hypothetical protein
MLSSCGGGGPGQVAADACMVEVDQRLNGKTYEVDVPQLAASASASSDAADTLQLSGPIVFDRGLGTEFTQTLRCKVRVAGQSASVLSIEFIWDMKDLKLQG